MTWYIIDGYNLINKIENLQNKQLKDKREYFINLLINRKSYKNNKLTVVFDGKHEVVYSTNKQLLKEYNIEIIFTEFETADEKIKKIVEKYKNPKEIVIITDDKEIQYYVRYYGCRILNSNEFFNRLNSKVKNDTLEKPHTKLLSKEEENSINQEIKKIYKLK